MSKSNTVYVLVDTNDKLWGVFNNDILLENMVYTLQETNGVKNKYCVKEIFMNTNICKSICEDIKFKNNHLDKNNNNRKSYNKCIQREIENIEKKYEKFVSLRNSFSKLEVNQEIPSFFKTEYDCFQEMMEKKIPEEEQFNFFLENYFALL
jgi:hypothetical protein